MRVGLWRNLSTKKLMLLNCGVAEYCWESPGLQESQPVHPKGDQSWVFIGRTDPEAETPNTFATPCGELTQWKRPWCWEVLGEGRQWDNREWDGWMTWLTQWTWVCVNPGSWWWTGRSGVLWFMGSQRNNWETTEWLNWTDLNFTAYGDCSHNIKTLAPWKKTHDQSR